MRISRVVRFSVVVALLSFNVSYSQTTEIIKYDSGFTWRGYTGSEQPLCLTRLCHYYPMEDWDPYYTESTIWKSDTGRPGEASAFMNFRIKFPNGYDIHDDTRKYPVIIMLHGAGESGRVWDGNFEYTEDQPEFDNNSNHLLNGGNEHRLAVEANTFPGIVVFPQASFSGAWDNPNMPLTQNENFIIQLIENYLVPRYHADINRIAMHGLSAGATGTWGFAQKRPDLFASVLVMSGVPLDLAGAKDSLLTTPIRIFQGGLDTNPRPFSSQEVVEAFEAEGGTPEMFLYEDLAHNTWERAYAETDFFSWILNNDKRNVFVFDNKTTVCPGVDTVKLGFSGNMKKYRWSKDGVDMSAGMGRYLNVLNPGTYKLKFRRPNGETDYSYIVNIGLQEGCSVAVDYPGEDPPIGDDDDDDPVTAVADDPSATWSNEIYPNPGTDLVYIASMKAEEINSVHLISASGQLIHVPVTMSGEGKAELNVSALDPGVYVVRSGAKSFRFLKRQ